MEKVLQSSQLAAVLSVDKEHLLESVSSPQPFRFQPKLTLIVDYTEYKDFLSIIPKDWEFLYRPPRVASTQDTLKCYYMDVLRAVLSELFFASYVSREAGITVYPTHIRHRLPDVPTVPLESLYLKKAQVVRVLSENIGCTNIMAQSYSEDWTYACALCELAQTQQQVNFL